MVKERLMIPVRKLLFKKYMKIHNIYIYIYIFNNVKEKKITEKERIPLLGFKKKY